MGFLFLLLLDGKWEIMLRNSPYMKLTELEVNSMLNGHCDERNVHRIAEEGTAFASFNIMPVYFKTTGI